MKPLFIPLMTEYYNAFVSGEKKYELRLAGSRWNEKTCYIGRPVTLSKGYGKNNRTSGFVFDYYEQTADKLEQPYRNQFLAVYGTLEKTVSCIGINIGDNQ